MSAILNRSARLSKRPERMSMNSTSMSLQDFNIICVTRDGTYFSMNSQDVKMTNTAVLDNMYNLNIEGKNLNERS